MSRVDVTAEELALVVEVQRAGLHGDDSRCEVLQDMERRGLGTMGYHHGWSFDLDARVMPALLAEFVALREVADTVEAAMSVETPESVRRALAKYGALVKEEGR